MQKINNEKQNCEQTNTQAKRRHRGTVAALVAAAVLILSTTAIAATHYLNVDKVPEGETLTYTDEQGRELSYSTADTVVTVQAKSEGSHDVCFQAAYVPVAEDQADWWPYAIHLDELAETAGKTADALLAESGLTADEADSWYTTAWYDGEEGFFRINVYSGAVLDGTDFILDGSSTTVRETTIGGYEATFVSVDLSETPVGRSMPFQNHILLYSGEINCLVDVFGTYGFDELEKIVDGLTIRETELAALDTFSGSFSLIGGGVG